MKYRKINYGSIVKDILKMYKAMESGGELEFSALCEFFENMLGIPIDRARLLRMLTNQGIVSERQTKVVRIERGESVVVTVVRNMLVKT